MQELWLAASGKFEGNPKQKSRKARDAILSDCGAFVVNEGWLWRAK